MVLCSKLKMETVVSPINNPDQREFDKLNPETKQKFRDLDMDFIYVLWFQVSNLYSNTEDRLKVYKKYYDKF